MEDQKSGSMTGAVDSPEGVSPEITPTFASVQMTDQSTKQSPVDAVTAAKQLARQGTSTKKQYGKRAARHSGNQAASPSQPVNFFGVKDAQTGLAADTEAKNEVKTAPRTFVELLHTDFLEEKETPEPAQEVDQAPSSTQENRLYHPDHHKDLFSVELSKSGEDADEEEYEDDEEEIIDPDASLVDDYQYDEYEDKKRFYLSDWKKIEEYLAAQSEQGFHYTRHEGKKYFFKKGEPRHYYYKVLYFTNEPDADQMAQWEEDGWIRLNNLPSRHKKDAGWFVLRNEMQEGQLPKDIENEEEKYRYFKRFSSSCRSTMFLLFVVMCCFAVTAWLQYEFKGFLAVIIISVLLFLISLYVFLVYARMLSKSKKQASLLAARIRLAQNDPAYQALRHASESDEELDAEWNSLDQD